MKLFIDINSGSLIRGLTGLGAPAPRFTQNDKFYLNIVFVDNGVAVTSAIVGGNVVAIALKSALGGVSLISAGAYTTPDASTISVPIDLTSWDLADFFTNDVPASSNDWSLLFEVQVLALSGGYCQTYLQTPVLVSRDLNAFTSSGTPTGPITDNAGNAITDNAGNPITSN